MKVAGSRDVYLGSFYNPRYNDAKGLPGLEASMSRLPPDGYKILAGDFNLPDVDWESSSVKPFNTRVYGAAEVGTNVHFF